MWQFPELLWMFLSDLQVLRWTQPLACGLRFDTLTKTVATALLPFFFFFKWPLAWHKMGTTEVCSFHFICFEHSAGINFNFFALVEIVFHTVLILEPPFDKKLSNKWREFLSVDQPYLKIMSFVFYYQLLDKQKKFITIKRSVHITQIDCPLCS